ncbi:MAG TPA: hypothetical protein VKK79_25095 [Candidatus Lokiarchaeia archaeon]|nr:hypothetical protein [Candidatus Lokiarchaeia archaeon]
MSVEPMEPFFKEIKEPTELIMTGNYAVAGAVTQTDPDVICAFPITPQTQSVEGLADIVNHGRIQASFVNVESEHAAMSYSTGAALTGARVFTATASQGYLLMCEALPMASGWRLPITMMISARAFNSPNLNIWNGWEFTLFDMGWNQILSENVQESYDSAILAVMIANKSMFPTAFIHDGFITSHSMQKFFAIPDEDVVKMTPNLQQHKVDTANPSVWGGLVSPEFFMEQRFGADKAKNGVPPLIDEAFAEFAQVTGREYKQVETFNLEGNKQAIITMGSLCGTMITWMKKNPDVGLIKLRTYRPFPTELLSSILSSNGIEKVAVLEKLDAIGSPIPPVGASVISATAPLCIPMKSYILAQGGRDVTNDEFDFVKRKMEKLTKVEPPFYDWVGLREKADQLYEGE